MLTFGIIGNGNHAKRIRKIINCALPDARFVIFDRHAEFRSWPNILNTDALFIASPNNTHVEYMQKLTESAYKGYIYCEKPVVNDISKIDYIESLDRDRIFLGLNFRYSDIPSIIDSLLSKYDLGHCLRLEINISYPFVLQDHYKNSWKSSSKFCPLGVLENLGIHFIDFAIQCLGRPAVVSSHLRKLNSNSDTFDWSQTDIIFQDNSTATICNSYTTPYRNELRLNFLRGEIFIDDQGVTLVYPRDSFDSNGLSIRPPSISVDQRSLDDLFGASLGSCVRYFLSYVQKGKSLSKQDFANSILSIQTMLNTVDKLGANVDL